MQQLNLAMIDGYRMVFKTAGNPQNPAIMFIHGWLGDHHIWDTTIPYFKDTHFCIAPDLIGQGGSDIPPDADYSIPAQARRILALADHLNISKMAVVGHSMGGQISGAIAGHITPERVTAYVSVDGVVTGKVTTGVRIRIPLFQIGQYVPLLYSISKVFVQLKPIAYLVHGRLLFYDTWALSPNVWRSGQRTFYSARTARTNMPLLNALRDYDLTPHLGSITAPVLAITGDHDRVIDPEEAKYLAEHAPNAQLAIIENCGHQPMFEAWEQYHKVLKDFLSSQ